MYSVKCIKSVRWGFGNLNPILVQMKEGKIYTELGKKDYDDLITHKYAIHHEVTEMENKMISIEYPTTLPDSKIYDPKDDTDEIVNLLDVEDHMNKTEPDCNTMATKSRGRPKNTVVE